MSETCGRGVDVGWIGYPAMDPNTLGFFAGTVTGRLQSGNGYMIDGVRVTGVSGGPIFRHSSDKIQILGCVSEDCIASQGVFEVGPLRAHDVSHFHDAIIGRCHFH